VERLLAAYLGFTTLLGLRRLPAQPAIAWVLLANVLIALLIILLQRKDLGPFGRVMREIYPVVLLAALYPAIDILNRFGAVTVHDQLVRAWEYRLFGGDLSREWWQRQPSVLWSTVLHAAYFAYYPIIVAPVAVFLTQRRQAETERTVAWLLAAFLVCYTGFLLFPVAGPYYEFPRPAAWFIDNGPARLVYATLARGSAYGAAFPSSHVAATLVATFAAFRGSRVLGALLILPAALLTIGVVYCQMHYGVDAAAGLVVGAIVVAIGSWREAQRGADRDLSRPAPR
jgi:membrane-associated phospholipid phosphatase